MGGPRVALVLTVAVLAGCLDAATDVVDDVDRPGPDWRLLASAPTPRTEVVAAALDGRVLVIGGFTGDGAATAMTEAFDVEADAWSTAAAYPVPVHHAAAVAVDGTLYVVGGWVSPPGLPEPFPPVPAATSLVHRYDDGADAWVQVSPLPDARAAHAAAVVDGRIHVVGGYDARLELADVGYVYDAAADAWEEMPAPPTLRQHTAAAALDGRVYLVGGDVRSHAENVAAVESYDPATREWTAHAPLPTPRGSLQAQAWDGMVVAVGGQTGDRTFATVEAYDPATDAWVDLPDLVTGRHGFGSAVVDGTLLVLAGGPEPGLSVTGSVEALG